MNKYIDADKLIAEIERFSTTEYGGNTLGDDVANGALNYVLEEIIPSLQQDKEVLDLCSQVWWEDRGWMMIPPNITLKGIESLLERVRHKIKWNKENGIKEQEQPEVDLEKEILRYQRENMDRDTTVRDVARHFWNMGYNAGKE